MAELVVFTTMAYSDHDRLRRLTFEFILSDAYDVDYEGYH